MLIAGPRSLLSNVGSSGNQITVSLNLTHLYHRNSAVVVMSGILPFTKLLGTWPFKWWRLCAVFNRTKALRSTLWSHSTFCVLVRTICLATPFFSSRIALSAALEKGVWGSVCLKVNASLTAFAPKLAHDLFTCTIHYHDIGNSVPDK